MTIRTIPVLASALAGLRAYDAQVERAARAIAGFGLPDAPDAPAGGAPAQPPGQDASPGGGLDEAMVSMLVAQRAFAAQLRVIETADEMAKETIDLPGDGRGH